jgi:hypothetical protein
VRGTICDVCDKYQDITEFCSYHHEKTDEAVCQACLCARLETGTCVMGGDHGEDSAIIGVEFNDAVFADLCDDHRVLSLELTALGYKVTREYNNWATIEYGPPVIRRLKGLADPGEALNGITESIWNLLWV